MSSIDPNILYYPEAFVKHFWTIKFIVDGVFNRFLFLSFSLAFAFKGRKTRHLLVVFGELIQGCNPEIIIFMSS